MKFFRRKKEKPLSAGMKRIVTGLIIGGAIGSVVGNKLLDKHDNDDEEQKDDEE